MKDTGGEIAGAPGNQASSQQKANADNNPRVVVHLVHRVGCY
jgi:hypothetical protein